MSEAARLRRLDGLFAERVLGKTLVMGKHYDRQEEVWVEEMKLAPGSHSPDYFMPSWIPNYTRSLDAAWEGAATKFKIFDISYVRGSSHVEIESHPGYEDMADASHPAEALVLACLRAVGVAEEELV